MPSFADRLHAAIEAKGNAALVGLDPRSGQLPEELRPATNSPAAWASAYTEFCKGVIDVVAPLVPATKPQAAFFEQLGPDGMRALQEVIQYARDAGMLVILDAKRGDIGSTAEAYARAYLGSGSAYQADSLTVNPYLGDDSLSPFVERAISEDAHVFVLVKTSNPGGKCFQDLQASDRPIFEHVAQLVEGLAERSKTHSGYGAVGAVVGATYPQELESLRKQMPHAILLIPGFGSQGGTAADVAPGFDARGGGALVNSSRAIIFAAQRPEYKELAKQGWQTAVEQATKDMIGQLRAALQTT